MADTPTLQVKQLTIKDAIVELEIARKSTVVSYMATQEALIEPQDAALLVDAIEQVVPGPGQKIAKLDLFLQSPGGFLDAAYKLVRICKDYAVEFNVIVPLAAKSAATVICLGAHEIVMTSLAELGPIDPIIQHPFRPEIRVPARSIKDFFTFMSTADTTQAPIDKGFKDAMAERLDPYLLGSYQTALESSKQVAELLLSEGPLKDDKVKIVAAVKELTERYASHGFVIDRNRAKEIGLPVTKAEDDAPTSLAIRQLMQVYSQFMGANRMIKLVGNRESNRTLQVAPSMVGNSGAPTAAKFQL